MGLGWLVDKIGGFLNNLSRGQRLELILFLVLVLAALRQIGFDLTGPLWLAVTG